MHVIGIPVADGYEKGLFKQVAKPRFSQKRGCRISKTK